MGIAFKGSVGICSGPAVRVGAKRLHPRTLSPSLSKDLKYHVQHLKRRFRGTHDFGDPSIPLWSLNSRRCTQDDSVFGCGARDDGASRATSAL
jgi:hypothetical protein